MVSTTPLARILNTGEIDPLKLVVRLYRQQNLMDARGVPLDDVKQHYHAQTTQLGQHPYKLINLRLGRKWEGEWFTRSGCSGIFKPENESFWPALSVLENCHVVEWAVYTTNGEPSPNPADNGELVELDPRKIGASDLRDLEHPESYPKIIRAKCLDCVGGQPSEVRKCVCVDCPLWPVRMGVNAPVCVHSNASGRARTLCQELPSLVRTAG